MSENIGFTDSKAVRRVHSHSRTFLYATCYMISYV